MVCVLIDYHLRLGLTRLTVRCSVTLAVLSTSAARTCLVCSRKTRVPGSSEFQVDEAETASQLLLRVARCCLFCGGRWTMGY